MRVSTNTITTINRNGMRSTLLTLTELGMILYWLVVSAGFLGLLHFNQVYMFTEYSNPVMVAWNWSFFPLDMLFAILGLYGRFGQISNSQTRFLSNVSLSLMFCAGLMALSFWAIQGDLDWAWWSVNVWLVCLSSFYLFRSYAYRAA